MGLSASQTRMLSLTARKSNSEFQGQQVNQQRLLLAAQSDAAADRYADGIGNRRIFVTMPGDQEVRASHASLTVLGYRMLDENGNAVPDDISDDLLEIGLRNGTITLTTGNLTPEGEVERLIWTSESAIEDRLYEDDDAVVSAIYEQQVTRIQSQDKKLELELTRLDSEQEALQTELDAVKKVIDKNIEESFKTFA